MRQSLRQPLFSAFLAITLICFLSPLIAHADDYMNDALPPVILKHVSVPLAKVGSGTYRKLGFTIYRATLAAL
jgi:hypothetical protein